MMQTIPWIVAAVVLSVGCSKKKAEPGTTSEAPSVPPADEGAKAAAPTPPATSAPKITEIEMPEGETECATGAPEQPLLDWKADAYTSVAHGANSEHFIERVVLGDATVEVNRGGCEDFSETYTVTYPKRAGTFNDELSHAIQIASKLVFAGNDEADLPFIAEHIEKAIADGVNLEERCWIGVDEMASVSCAVSTTEDGKTRGVFSKDLSL